MITITDILQWADWVQRSPLAGERERVIADAIWMANRRHESKFSVHVTGANIKTEGSDEKQRKKLISGIESLFPPDDHECGIDLLINAIAQNWRSLPTDTLKALHRECVRLDNKNARKL